MLIGPLSQKQKKKKFSQNQYLGQFLFYRRNSSLI